jgi:TonB family protein
MQLGLQKNPEVDQRRRRGLAVSAGLHLLLLIFFFLNPDLLTTSPRQVVHLSGEEYDLDRFEVVELFAPPEIAELRPVQPALPSPAAAPAPEPLLSEPPPPAPQPELPPVPPPPVIGPDDLIAEGARPDAPESGAEPEESAALAPPRPPESEAPAGDGGGEDAEFSDALTPDSPDPEPPIQVADSSRSGGPVLPSLRQQVESLSEDMTSGRRGIRGEPDRLPGAPNLATETPAILSDTRGYDFGPYMNQVINRVRTNWYSLIPEVARIGGESGRVVIVFTITRSGRIEGLRAVLGSGSVPLDRAAAAAIQASNPFQSLPVDFDGNQLVLQFTFLYNIAPSRN